MVIQLIDNNRDDKELITEILESFVQPTKIIHFNHNTKVVDYLKPPGVYAFLVILGINMPFINGYELWEQIAQKFFRKAGYNVQHKKAQADYGLPHNMVLLLTKS